MSVHPVHFNGMIQNTQDVSTIRHQEDQKPAVEQQNIQIQKEQREQSQAQGVQKKEDADNQQKKFDAKEKGSNEYESQRRKKREKRENLPDGSVKLKMTMSGGFDIKV